MVGDRLTGYGFRVVVRAVLDCARSRLQAMGGSHALAHAQTHQHDHNHSCAVLQRKLEDLSKRSAMKEADELVRSQPHSDLSASVECALAHTRAHRMNPARAP